MRCTAYDEYKPSGIEWLGNVPSHWTIARSDGIVSSERRQVQPEVFLSEDVFHYSIPLVQELGTGAVEEGESIKSAKQPVFRKSLLVSKLNPRKATIVVAEPQPDLRTLCSTEFVTLFADKCDLGFLTYVTLSEAFRQRLDAAVQSVTRSHQRANPRDIYSFWNAWPPLDEQQTIARFLDAKTAQIDELIAKKRQLIAKLKEKRQALIARTVTRGLPPEAAKAAGLEPNPDMKDSGVGWLGSVPARWEVKAIKWATPVQRGASPRPIDDPSYFDDDGEYAWVRISDVTAAGMYLDATEQRLSDLGSSLSVKIEPGGLFLSIAGTVGKPCIANIKCCIHDGFVYFPLWKGEPRFLFYLFASGEPYKGLGKMGTQLNLNTDTVGSIVISVPAAAEQKLITDYLDRTTAELDKMATTVEAAIARLTEYRQALITSAVTGKIDVRATA